MGGPYHGDRAICWKLTLINRLWKKDKDVDPTLRKCRSLPLMTLRLTSNTARNFQLRLAVSGIEESDVWLLLSRHVVDLKREAEYIAMSTHVEDDFGQSDLSPKVRQAWLGRENGTNRDMQGSYTNNIHVLVSNGPSCL